MRRLSTLASAFVLAFASASVSAASVVLDFTVKGTFANFGSNNAAFGAGAGNTLTGQDNQGFHRGYWVFDLTGVTAPILSGTLSLGMPANGYISDDATETLAIYDYTSDIALLQNQSTSGAAGIGAYNDLGSGELFGSKVVSNADEFPCGGGCTINDFKPLLIDLDGPSFLSAINAARGGLFAVGGTLTTAVAGAPSELVFAFTDNAHGAQLALNVAAIPEPSTYALLVTGLAIVGFAARRRGATNAAA